MSLERPTLQVIYDRMRADMESRVTSATRIPTASLLNILVIIFAGGIHLVYGYLQKMIDQLFTDTAISSFLVRIANIFGINEKPAAFATGLVTFSGTTLKVVPQGTAVVDSNSLVFLTTEAYTIGISPAVEIIAENPGEDYNLTGVNFLALQNTINGVNDSVELLNAETTGGQDAETTEELRLRVLQRQQNPPASGAKSDYVRWALEVPGVEKAFILGGAEYLGGGSVAIIVSQANFDSVGATVIDQTQKNIDAQKPIGARFANVLDISTKPIIYFLKINPNTDANKASIEESLERLHQLEAEPGGTIYVSQIQGAIAETPLINFEISNIVIDGVPGDPRDIVMTGQDVAKIQSISISTL